MLVVLFGAIGWLMVKFDWQRPPLLLGLVLGGIAENNLFIASRIYGYSWLCTREFWSLGRSFVRHAFPYLQAWFKKHSASGDTSEAAQRGAVTRIVHVPFLTRITGSVFALLIVGVMSYVVYEAMYGFGAFEPRAGIFPWVVGVPCLALALYIFAKEALTSTQEIKIGGQFALPDEPEIEPIVERQRTFAIGCWIVGFFIAIWIVGFIPASAIATFLYLKFGAGDDRR